MNQKILLLVSWLFATVLFTSTAQADTIRVGTTQSLTGIYKEFGQEQLRGLRMWVDDINARGALLGQDVVLVHYDDRSNKERSAGLYRKLIEENNIDLLVGPYGSDHSSGLSRTHLAARLQKYLWY
jgi:branched-chain amino acid transport system substrate-binding protein